MKEKYNTFKDRIKSLIVDGLVFTPLTITNLFLIKYSQNILLIILVMWALLFPISRVIYRIVLHYKYGKTIGKKYFKVKVVSFPDEKKLSLKQAILREIPIVFFTTISLSYTIAMIINTGVYLSNYKTTFNWTIFTLTMLWFIADLIILLKNDKRRALHDMIGNTIVIKTE